MLLQLLALLAIIPLGIQLSFIARRAAMHGFEIWLPLAILVSFGISPLVGYIVAMMIVIGGWVLWPFELENVGLMAFSLALTCWATSLFTLTAGNLVLLCMALTAFYNLISNGIYLFLSGNWFSMFKFIILSIWTSWLIYQHIGWEFVTWLMAG